ncbi:MAG TPA: peptidylprolyl isomerase, partial [Myxococcales bacterium]|nr:peptidylprolyl isomerase [Myxococcales bacterium]
NEILDTSAGSDPLMYLHGSGNIVEGLENALNDKIVGDTFKVAVPPSEGYGEHNGEEPMGLPKSNFPDEEIQLGMMFHAEGESGEHFALWVVDVQGDEVFVDVNHPLAGVTLNFDVEVSAIRVASDEEKTHGHPHGPGGHQH